MSNLANAIPSNLVIKTANHYQVKQELEIAFDHALKNRRVIPEFIETAILMATYNEDVAASCIFTLPRKAKNPKTNKYETIYIKGKSIRLAEIVLSIYRNLIVKIKDGPITELKPTVKEPATGVATGIATIIDLENNSTLEEEASVNIYGEHADAKKLAMAAAHSIALRKVTFRLIPNAFTDLIYKKAVECAVGDQKSFNTKRQSVFDRIAKLGITKERILEFYEKKYIEDITQETLEEIIGIATSLKEGIIKIDDAFVKNDKEDDEKPDAAQSVNNLIKNKNQPITSTTPTPAAPASQPIPAAPQPQAQAVTNDVMTGVAAVNANVLKKQIENAKSLETLELAADLIKDTAPDRQDELRNYYLERKKIFQV